jgi:hypothetical protein
MSNQYLKLRRSAVPGRIPTTSSIEFGEIALNTYDGKAYMKKSGSSGEQVIALGSGTISGSNFYVPVFSGSEALVPSTIYDSGSFTAIGATEPIDVLNPDRLFIDAGNTTSYNLLSGHGSIDNYLQLNVQNFSAGATASSDIVATADNGGEDDYYINMGINNSGYSITGSVGIAGDSYLYNLGGDLLIGNASQNNRVIIFNGGTPALDNARIFITNEGTVGINASDSNLNNPEALLIEPLPGNPSNNFSNLIIGRGTVHESYLQFNLINQGTGSYASADIVASNDISTETSNYIDMGINSSNHIVDTTFAPGGPNDTYLLSTGRDLLIGSSTSGSITLWTGTNFDDKANAKLTLRNNNQHSLTGSLSATQGFTGSLFGTASWAVSASWAPIQTTVATASYVSSSNVYGPYGFDSIQTSSYALTASSADNFTVRGTLTAQTIIVQTITSSTDFVTGSTKFGSLLSNTHQFTGSVSITGSLNVTGPTTINNLTGSLFGTASWANNATTASYVLQAVSASFATSASQAQTASYILQAVSASFAITASYALNAGGSTIDTGSFATTGSNIFKGNQTITGSLNLTGSIITNTDLPIQINSINQVGSLVFEGISSLTMSPGIIVGSGSYTAESFIYINDYDNRNVIFAATTPGGSGFSFGTLSVNQIFTDRDGVSANVYDFASNFPINQWFHVAVTRNSAGQETVFVNGIKSTSAYGTNVNYSGNTEAIGRFNEGVWIIRGRISQARLVVGSNVYDPTLSTITVPTSSLTNITNTKVLLNILSAGTYLNDTSDNQIITNSASVTFNSSGPVSSSLSTVEFLFKSNGDLTTPNNVIVGGAVSASSFTGSLLGTATTASYVLQAVSASFATSASQASTASYVLNAESASFATSASNALSSSYAVDATNATNAISASYINGANVVGTVTSASYASEASNAATADFASIAGNGGVTNIVAGSGITLIPASGVGAVTIITSGGGGTTIISGSNVTQSFNNSATWTFDHNLGTRTPIITVFDNNYKQIIPQDIELVDTASATITFPVAESGFAVASLGGATGTVFSSSYSLFSTYATTASYYDETDPVFVAKSGSFATTSSNRFVGNQIITGSLIVSGSSTFTNIGPAVFSGSVSISGSTTIVGTTNFSNTATTITGSLLVSGSTTQVGNNTLTGNTALSGSINISGSSTIRGTTIMSGSLLISGSTTQIGNNTLAGTTTLTGSILINGNIVPEISSSFDLGSETNPWRSLYVQSGSISIQSDIPGGIPAVISNANGDVTIAGAGFQIKSGSATPFNITPAGLITINTPKTLLTTEAGVSIIGSSTGYQQPRNFTGTLLQLTAQDNQSGRISIDSFGTGVYGLLAGRTARGTVNTPLQTKAGDTLFRITAQGWTNSNAYIGSIVRTDWEAAEDFTSTSAGTRLRFQTTPTGSTTIQTSAIIDSTGITIPSSSRLFGTSSWASNAQTASYVNPLNQNVVISGSAFISGSITIINDANLITHNIKALGSNGLQILANNGAVIATMGQGGGSQANFTGSLSSTQFTAPSITGSLFGTASWANNAQTASYINPLNQNVVITGSLKVSGSLTEIGDTVLTGSLTLSSGSRLNINDGFYVNGNKQFNYGQFSSTQTQSGSANTAYSATFNTTQFSQGVSLVSQSRITVSNTGIYNIQFSSQLHTTANQAVDFSIWFAMTGSDIANSNTEFTIEKINGGGFQVAALNFLTSIASGSYVELKYSKTTTQGQLYAIGAQSTPTRPATPSVILTVTQIA